MRKFIFSFVIVVSSTIMNQASAEKLSDASFLRKLSLHIKGSSPTREEYNELKSLGSEQERQDFFAQKVSDYLATVDHQSRMTFRLTELFRVKTPEIPWNEFSSTGNSDLGFSGVAKRRDVLTDLFDRLTKDNLSWDELLVGKHYTVYPRFDFTAGRINDGSFYSLLQDNFATFTPGSARQRNLRSSFKYITEPTAIDFEEGDSRIAGALTTPRFLSRYSTTAINMNRRRAAAVFRIFLCDEMIPAIEASDNRKHEFLDSAFASSSGVTEDDLRSQIEAIASSDRHGTDAQCMSCHAKLDPLGVTFQGSGAVLHPKPFAGRLYYKNNSDEQVNIPGQGIGDLAQAITEQHEYESCQVTWFWDQFIGKDIPIRAKTRQELIDNFNRVERRTNDFVQYIVSRPEFREKPSKIPHIEFGQVQNLLKRCDSCHQGEGYIPNFASLPIGFSKTSEEQVKWLNEMQKRLNLSYDHKESMPRDIGNWKHQDIELIKTWLKQGAHDDQGQMLIKSTYEGGQK